MDGERSADTETEAADAAAEEEPAQSRLGVNGTQVCASTLASVSAAIVSSIFGVTGTVVGAAVVAVIATTGSALYDHGIRKTGERLQQMPAIRPARPLVRREQAAGWKDWLAERRWGVAAGVAIVLVASLATVTLIELVGRQPLAGIAGDDGSGGTSIGSLFDGADQDAPDDTPPTTDPSGGPTSTTSEPSAEEPGPSTTGSEGTDPSSPTTGEPPGDADPSE